MPLNKPVPNSGYSKESFIITSLESEESIDADILLLFMAMYDELIAEVEEVASAFKADALKGAAPYKNERCNLWLASCEGEPAGCVGIKQFTPEIAELKRVYIAPKFRGAGLSRTLMEHALTFAKQAAYQKIYLDTLRTLTTAHQLYSDYGFKRISPYNELPPELVYHMELAL